MVHGDVSHREVCEVSLGKLWLAQLRQYDECAPRPSCQSPAAFLNFGTMALERIRCRDASGSQEAPLGEAQGGDMAAKLATGLVAINSWKQLGNA